MVMSEQVEIMKVEGLDEPKRGQLAELLISIVADGASVGFLAPLSMDEALDYWDHVLGPDALLWTAVIDGKVVGTVQLHLAMKANGAHRAEVAKLMVPRVTGRRGLAAG